jgi:transposase
MKNSLITNTHGFTTEALRKEERTISDALLRQRVLAVRLILEGFSTVKAAEVLGICRQSVSTYAKMFNRGGVAELLHRDFPPGKQPYLSLEEQAELKRVILESTPEQEGVEPTGSWDTRLLQKWIEERFSVTMSRSGITDMLHRLGFCWKRTTYVLAKANKEKQQAFVHQLEAIKKLDGRKYRTACTR